MSNFNPYAPPETEQPFFGAVAPGPEGGYWREGEQLVLDKRLSGRAFQQGGSVLPNRCVKCNAPATQTLKKKFYWHTPWIYILIFLSILIYAIVALIIRKKAEVALPLCDTHSLRRKLGLWIGWGGSILSLIVMGASPAVDSPVLLLLGVLGMLSAVLIGVFMSQVATPKKIDDHQCWLKVGTPFLYSITATGPQFMPPAVGPEPAGGFGAPPAGGFGAPPAGGFGAPPAGGFGAPPAGGFGGPPAGGFGGPPPNT